MIINVRFNFRMLIQRTFMMFGVGYKHCLFSCSYTIDDLPYDRAYLVSLQIMDCYQSSDPQCLSVDTFTVLERSIIPKALCSWDHSFITTSK